MLLLESIADKWSNQLALHAVPFFVEGASSSKLQRRNAVWNWGFLAFQALALASYNFAQNWTLGPVVFALAFAVGAYGWLDLSLCIVRKTFLVHLRRNELGEEFDAERIQSAWLMFVSAAIVYANLFYAISHVEGQFDKGIHGPVSALACSVSTITTVGYGYYSPVGAFAVILALLEAMSGIALISCVISAAISRALSSPGAVTTETQIIRRGYLLPLLVAFVILSVGYLMGSELVP